VRIQFTSRYIVGDDFIIFFYLCCSHFCACFAMLFASLLQSLHRPPLNPQLGASWRQRAPCDTKTPYIGEKGATRTKRHHGVKGTHRTTVKGPTEGKLKFFSYSRMAVDITKNYLFKLTTLLITGTYSNLKRKREGYFFQFFSTFT